MPFGRFLLSFHETHRLFRMRLFYDMCLDLARYNQCFVTSFSRRYSPVSIQLLFDFFVDTFPHILWIRLGIRDGHPFPDTARHIVKLRGAIS
jgi:hypothetical protein